jgi:folate-binding protein YgfZ
MLTETYRTDQIPLSDAFGGPYPDAFTHPRVEYEMLTHHAGIVDLSHWGVLRLTGSDRATFLNAMVTNDVAALTAGHSCPALMTTTKGKIFAQLLVIAQEDELTVLVMQGDRARVIDALASHIIADDVTLDDVSGDYGVLSAEGPSARELVWRLFPREPLPLRDGEVTRNSYLDIAATVIRHTVAGDKGMHVLTARDSFARLRDYLVQGGVGIDCGPVGRVAWNTRRIENGLPWLGSDVTEDNFPKEARLDDHVSYEKGCYLGQETIARMHYRGHPNWQLVGLTAPNAPFAYREAWEQVAGLPTLERDAEAAHRDLVAWGAPATAIGAGLFEPSDRNGKAVGRITSATFSPALQSPLFLGMVRASMTAAGTTLATTFGGVSVTMTVVELPVATT